MSLETFWNEPPIGWYDEILEKGLLRAREDGSGQFEIGSQALALYSFGTFSLEKALSFVNRAYLETKEEGKENFKDFLKGGFPQLSSLIDQL